MAFWSLVGMLLFPFGKTLLAMPPIPDQTDPAVCPGFTLPPASPELDQILAAQQAISEAVFPAGGADYLYCEEGAWWIDEELNEAKEIHSGTDNPISGVTFGGDDFLFYPFFISDIDLDTLNLDGDILQKANDEHLNLSFVGGIIETALGTSGFMGFYSAVDDGSGRSLTIIPYLTTDSFNERYNDWFILGINRWEFSHDKIGTCLSNHYIDYGVCLDKALIDYAACLKRALIGSGSATIIICLTPGVGQIVCGVSFLVGMFAGLLVCRTNHDADVAKCEVQWKADQLKCNPPSSNGG